jgi:hypothetical protein
MILVGEDQGIWKDGRGRPRYLERNLSHCQFEHHKSHIIIPKACYWQMNFYIAEWILA